MEAPESWITYWWTVIPIAVLLWIVYAATRSGTSLAYRVACASLAFGIAGLLFCPVAPLAVYFGRKARALDDGDSSVMKTARIGTVVGVLGCVVLSFVLLISGSYFYAWLAGQYPYNQAPP